MCQYTFYAYSLSDFRPFPWIFAIVFEFFWVPQHTYLPFKATEERTFWARSGTYNEVRPKQFLFETPPLAHASIYRLNFKRRQLLCVLSLYVHRLANVLLVMGLIVCVPVQHLGHCRRPKSLIADNSFVYTI